MAADELGRAVHHCRRAERQWLLPERSRESVVDDDRHSSRTCSVDERAQVRDPEQRVRRRFEPEKGCSVEGRDDSVRVCRVDGANSEPTDLHPVSEKLADSEVTNLRSHDDRPARQRLQHRRNSAHPRREGKTDAALDHAERFFQGRHCRVAIPAIGDATVGSVGRAEHKRSIQWRATFSPGSAQSRHKRRRGQLPVLRV